MEVSGFRYLSPLFLINFIIHLTKKSNIIMKPLSFHHRTKLAMNLDRNNPSMRIINHFKPEILPAIQFVWSLVIGVLLLFAISILAALSIPASYAAGVPVIETIAGTGAGGFSGDGGAATSAQLYEPNSVAFDSSGNLYIADRNNHRVRKITSDGIISTFAGTTSAGFSGDGGAATSAQLSHPNGVTFDGSGNLYIADSGNNCVRKVTPSGIISTFAGTCGSSGNSADNGLATSALLNTPLSVAFDNSGNLYIADYSNHRVRKVTSSGTISTFAGTTGGFSGDGGAATSAQLNTPSGVAVDSSGNLYIGDQYNHRVRKVALDGIISTFAGTTTGGFSGDGGAATNAQLRNPTGVVFDSSGNLYIADTANHSVRKITPAGTISTVTGTGAAGFNGNGIAATSAQLNYPYGVGVDGSGGLYITDNLNRRIRKIVFYYDLTLSTTGTGTGTISSSGTPAGISCGTNCLSYLGTTAVTLSTTADPSNGSTFASWSCTPALTSSNTLTANTTCTATFNSNVPIPHYHLSLLTEGDGVGTVSGAGSYPAGSTVTLTATPNEGSTFVGWSGGCSNIMTLSSDMTCTATFMGPPEQHTLTISFAGNGQGQVTGGQANDPEGIHCDAGSIPCAYTVSGTQWVYPKITAATGSEFQGWSGDPACTDSGLSKILLLADTACTVTFNLQYYTLTVDKNAPGVTVMGEGLTCQDTEQGFLNLENWENLTLCQTTYPYGTTVKLDASPAPPEWEWVGWSGSCDSQGQVLMTNDRWCRAQYREDPHIPNGMDGNGDGLNDTQQPNVMSLSDKVTGNYITLVVNPECTVADGSTVTAEMLGGAERNHPLPQGLMSFELQCSQAEVTMYFHSFQKLLRNLEFRKYGPQIPGDPNSVDWYQLPNVSFNLVTVGDKPVVTATYTLIDGQLGDSTGIDGRIVDPAGLGYTE